MKKGDKIELLECFHTFKKGHKFTVLEVGERGATIQDSKGTIIKEFLLIFDKELGTFREVKYKKT